MTHPNKHTASAIKAVDFVEPERKRQNKNERCGCPVFLSSWCIDVLVPNWFFSECPWGLCLSLDGQLGAHTTASASLKPSCSMSGATGDLESQGHDFWPSTHPLNSSLGLILDLRLVGSVPCLKNKPNQTKQNPFCIKGKPHSRQAVNHGSYLEEEDEDQKEKNHSFWIRAGRSTPQSQATTPWVEELLRKKLKVWGKLMMLGKTFFGTR